MTDEDKNPKDEYAAKKLAFVLSQLRDDLGELVEGLESGRLSYDAAHAGANAQLQWVLHALADESGSRG